MKTLMSLAMAAALLATVGSGCKTTGSGPSLSPALVQIAVQTGTAFGVEKYPQALPALRVATPVVCSAANGTNIQPAQIVAAIQAAGVGTNIEAIVILNGAIAIYDTIFESYGADWLTNRPQLTLYLKAVCDGLTAGLPPQGMATARAKALPPHL